MISGKKNEENYAIINTIVSGTLFFSLICAFLVFFRIITISTVKISALSVLVSICCVISFKTNNRIATFGLSSVLLLYTLCTQFGMVAVYFLLGRKFVSNYSSWTLAFLKSGNIVRAIAMGIIAVTVYTFSVNFASAKSCPFNERKPCKRKFGTYENNIVVHVGYLMLLVTLVYLLYFLATGKITLHSTYGDFIKNVSSDNATWNTILILYATGIAYIVSAANKKQMKIGFTLYGITALILFVTGNKGEVLYAVLACVGVYQYRGNKLNLKMILLCAVVLFFIIPVITSSRGEGVLNSVSLSGGDFTSSLTEMGMQIRLSVFVLDEVQNGTRDLIWGYSYYSPFINILDTMLLNIGIRLKPPESFNFISHFPGFGFSQIAEAYCNFGIIGVMIFYSVMGAVLSKIESKRVMLSPAQLAYFTSIITILINATRNRFAFVPGQILIMSFFYLAIYIRMETKKRQI